MNIKYNTKHRFFLLIAFAFLSTIATAQQTTEDVNLSDQPKSNDAFTIADISYFPNPAKDNLAVELGRNYNDIKVTIYSILGNAVTEKTAQNSSNINIDISDLSSGVYISFVETEYGEATTRFIKD